MYLADALCFGIAYLVFDTTGVTRTPSAQLRRPSEPQATPLHLTLHPTVCCVTHTRVRGGVSSPCRGHTGPPIPAGVRITGVHTAVTNSYESVVMVTCTVWIPPPTHDALTVGRAGSRLLRGAKVAGTTPPSHAPKCDVESAIIVWWDEEASKVSLVVVHHKATDTPLEAATPSNHALLSPQDDVAHIQGTLLRHCPRDTPTING